MPKVIENWSDEREAHIVQLTLTGYVIEKLDENRRRVAWSDGRVTHEGWFRDPPPAVDTVIKVDQLPARQRNLPEMWL